MFLEGVEEEVAALVAPYLACLLDQQIFLKVVLLHSCVEERFYCFLVFLGVLLGEEELVLSPVLIDSLIQDVQGTLYLVICSHWGKLVDLILNFFELCTI